MNVWLGMGDRLAFQIETMALRLTGRSTSKRVVTSPAMVVMKSSFVCTATCVPETDHTVCAPILSAEHARPAPGSLIDVRQLWELEKTKPQAIMVRIVAAARSLRVNKTPIEDCIVSYRANAILVIYGKADRQIDNSFFGIS